MPAIDWFDTYDEAIRNLEPRLNTIIIHPAYDNTEMQAMTFNAYDSYEAAWRQGDYDFVVSLRFKNLIEDENFQLVT